MKHIVFLFLSLSFSNLFAQQDEIDSLISVINTSENDSVKSSTLNALAWKFMFSNPDTTKIIAQTSQGIANKINDLNLLANATNNLATAFAVQGNFKTALDYFKAAERIAMKDDAAANLAMIENNIGLVHWNQGHLDSAILSYSKALQNFNRLDELKVGSANTHNNLGLIFNDQGELDSAIYHYKMALSIFDSLETKNRGVANTYNNIGIIYKERGNLPSSLDYYLKALRIFETIEDQSDGYANTLNNIGIIYKEQKEYGKALSYYKKAKTAFENISEHSVGLANTLNNIGIVHLLQNQVDLALEYYEEALKMQEGMGKQSLGMASSLSNIGLIKEKQGKTSQALTYYKRAQEIQTNIGDKKGVANSLFFIGNLQVENGEAREGVEKCLESFEMAKKLELLEIKMNACNCLADGYDQLDLNKKAFDYFKLFVNYKDSLSNQENTKAITQKAMQYEFDKIQYQDSLQRAEVEKRKALEQREKDLKKEAEIQRQRVYTTAGGVGFILMLGLAFVLFRGYKNKQKANEIITAQKNLVEEQKYAVEEQKEIIEEKNREIVDSITYAKRIQGAILPSNENMKTMLPESFVFFKPKDIVSGDFYWVDQKEELIFFAAVDCTGHGVPGAMVSVVGYNGLNRVLHEFGLTQPAQMLDKLNELVEQTFSKSDETVKDGMDLGLCSYNPKTNVLNFAGANNPLYLIRNKELIEYKADKQPIGKFDYRTQFTNHIVQLEKGDSIYIFSDGFADQFGGPRGKKFMYKPFKRLLTQFSELNAKAQHENLLKAFEEWKGDLEQIDDVCVFGVKI